jgi:hypothetical protein
VNEDFQNSVLIQEIERLNRVVDQLKDERQKLVQEKELLVSALEQYADATNWRRIPDRWPVDASYVDWWIEKGNGYDLADSVLETLEKPQKVEMETQDFSDQADEIEAFRRENVKLKAQLDAPSNPPVTGRFRSKLIFDRDGNPWLVNDDLHSSRNCVMIDS